MTSPLRDCSNLSPHDHTQQHCHTPTDSNGSLLHNSGWSIDELPLDSDLGIRIYAIDFLHVGFASPRPLQFLFTHYPRYHIISCRLKLLQRLQRFYNLLKRREMAKDDKLQAVNRRQFPDRWIDRRSKTNIWLKTRSKSLNTTTLSLSHHSDLLSLSNVKNVDANSVMSNRWYNLLVANSDHIELTNCW